MFKEHFFCTEGVATTVLVGISALIHVHNDHSSRGAQLRA